MTEEPIVIVSNHFAKKKLTIVLPHLLGSWPLPDPFSWLVGLSAIKLHVSCTPWPIKRHKIGFSLKLLSDNFGYCFKNVDSSLLNEETLTVIVSCLIVCLVHSQPIYTCVEKGPTKLICYSINDVSFPGITQVINSTFEPMHFPLFE